MIRVTTSQLHRASLNAVNDARVRMQETQRIAMTGKRVASASDDPAAAARSRILGDLDAASQSHLTNISYGIARLQTADDALAEISNQLLRAKEIALASSNETLTAEQRAASAAEVRQIRRTVIDLMNSKHLGEYTFAHIDTQNEPFDTATDTFSYDVDTFDSVRSVEVGPGQTAEIGASGSHAFAQRAADPNSVDVPAVLADLEANLTLNDPDAVRVDVDQITASYDQVVGERANVGVRMDRLWKAESAADQVSTVYKTLQSDLVDADAAEAFSNLSLAQTTMQAAVTVAARVLGPSLLDAL